MDGQYDTHDPAQRKRRTHEALTRVLNSEHETDADDDAHDLIYRELRAIASGVLGGHDERQNSRVSSCSANANSTPSRPAGRQRTNLTLLVHEAWIKLQRTQRWKNRAHFFGSASNAMRQVLVDEARKRNTQKHRVNHARIDPDFLSKKTPDLFAEVLAIDEAITRLAAEDERAARVAEMKLFGDITMETIAACLDVTLRTVQRDWRFARAWLADALSEA